MKQSIIDQPLMTINDIQPGMIVDGTIQVI